MERFPISHYKKSGSSIFVNGGTLTVTEGEYIVEYLKKEVARFSVQNTTVTKAPVELLYEGIRLTEGRASIDLYFLKTGNTATAIRDHFHI